MIIVFIGRITLSPSTESFGIMAQVKAECGYLAAGANRHPSAADWDLLSGLLAFGADRNVAIWRPQVCF